MPHAGPGSCKSAQSISWPDGVKDCLNHALTLLYLVLIVFVVFVNRCLGFLSSLGCSHICFAIKQPSDRLERLSFAPVK